MVRCRSSEDRRSLKYHRRFTMPTKQFLTTSPSMQHKWKLRTWLDIPLTLVGTSIFGVSNEVKVLGGPAGDDYMLRIAVSVDPDQYSKASELRHKRMIEACKNARAGWNSIGPLVLAALEMELDVHGKRAEESLIFQIKSTLRPETTWEVLKRNEEVIDGISHTSKAMARIGSGTLGFLITDGYRGDYQTWELANRLGVPIGTMEDAAEIGSNPAGAAELLKARVGFNAAGLGGPVPDQEFELFGWKFHRHGRLITHLKEVSIHPVASLFDQLKDLSGALAFTPEAAKLWNDFQRDNRSRTNRTDHSKEAELTRLSSAPIQALSVAMIFQACVCAKQHLPLKLISENVLRCAIEHLDCNLEAAVFLDSIADQQTTRNDAELLLAKIRVDFRHEGGSIYVPRSALTTKYAHHSGRPGSWTPQEIFYRFIPYLIREGEARLFEKVGKKETYVFKAES